jgi:hypothetical protein
MKTKYSNKYILNYQLGEFVGEFIVKTQLPIVNVYDFKIYEGISNVVGELDDEDKQKHTELDNNCFVNGKIDSDRHTEYVRFLHLLDEKYLPKTKTVYWNPILITNETAFIGGINSALWNSDISSYIVSTDSNIVEEYSLMSVDLTRER